MDDASSLDDPMEVQIKKNERKLREERLSSWTAIHLKLNDGPIYSLMTTVPFIFKKRPEEVEAAQRELSNKQIVQNFNVEEEKKFERDSNTYQDNDS